MQRTALYEFHKKYGGKMVDFAGWEMPMFYALPRRDGTTWGGIMEEHRQVRASGGMFDVSHMGRVRVSGRHARRFLEKLCTRRIADMQPGQCRYSLVCNENGGVHDDVIVYRMDDDDFMIVVNASNREKMLGHFERVKSGAHPAAVGAEYVVKIEDQTARTAMVALQGPKVMELIARVSKEVPALKRYRFAVKNLLVTKITVSRTGYTGEDGVEVILQSSFVDMAIKLLLKDVNMEAEDAAVRPAGLGARDSLRMEAAMPLYGHELGEETNALSCGVDFAISLDKAEGEHGDSFIGMDALKRTRDSGGPARRLVGVVLEGKRTARQGMVVKGGDAVIGAITSACISPTLGVPIAMAFVDIDRTAIGTPIRVETERAVLDGKVTALPFYKAAR